MRINIQARGFELTEGLRQHTERRLQFAIDWAGDDVKTVKVRFSDINGPRGGNDKRCTIQIPIAGQNDVMIEDTEADLYVAIDRAADRAEQTLSRKLERTREHKHQRFNVTDIDATRDEDSTTSTPTASWSN
ncbi:MAG: HPF/RaiA family ribosome-associated protein [Undibacterium sp.]|nr:HPF/RaiA family ribosome-associated protein [Undibacterium sp.]